MQEQTAKTRKKKKRRMRLPNGVGSVHLIGDGKTRRKPWRARVPSHVEFDEVKGTAVQKYITIGYFATEIEAIDALMEYRKNPFTLDAATCTFEELFERWKAKKYPTISESGKYAYNAAFKNSEALHKMKMRDIRTTHLDTIMQSIPSGYQVQNRLRTFWGQLFKYGMENDIIQKNYAEFVKLRDKDPGTQRTAIPDADRKKLWQAADAGDFDAQLALVYIYTGMRPAELLLIKKEDVNLEARIMVGGLKTAAGKNRRIPIHKEILPFITKLMKTEGDLLLMRYDTGKPTAFTYNRFLTSNWNPLMERLGFEVYTPHYCRHTTATMLREADVVEDIRKLILGHSSKDITDRYTHHADSTLVEAIDKLPVR